MGVRTRAFLAPLLAFVLTGTLVAVALADGDPASDVLLGQNVFYPYSPPASPAVAQRLDATVAAAAKAGFALKVALIASPVDLGVIPDLFGKPAQYAAFLDQEISVNVKQPLLVVMPTGFGAAGLSASAMSTLPRLSRPNGAQTDALAKATIDALPELAAASGHPFVPPRARPRLAARRGGSDGVLVFPALLLAALGLSIVGVRRRRRRTPMR